MFSDVDPDAQTAMFIAVTVTVCLCLIILTIIFGIHLLGGGANAACR
jgi:hypothetical protein